MRVPSDTRALWLSKPNAKLLFGDQARSGALAMYGLYLRLPMSLDIFTKDRCLLKRWKNRLLGASDGCNAPDAMAAANWKTLVDLTIVLTAPVVGV